MNRILEKAVAEVATLPDEVQSDLGNRLLEAVSRIRAIDAELAKGEQSLTKGSGIPAERLVAELRRRYGG
jgi:hypothetical protein